MPLTGQERTYWTDEVDRTIKDKIRRHESAHPNLTPNITQDSREEAEVRLGIEGYAKRCVELCSARDNISEKEESAQNSVLETYRTRTSALEKQKDVLEEALEKLYGERDQAKETIEKTFKEKRTSAEGRVSKHYENTFQALLAEGMVEDGTNNRYGSRQDPEDTIKQRIEDLSRIVQEEHLESSEPGAYRLKLERLRVQARNEIMLSSTITHIRGIWKFVAGFLGIYSDDFAEKFHEEVGTRRSRVVTFTVDADDESAVEEDT
jgi:hypothetical protein